MPVLLYFMTILLRFERYLKTNLPVLFIRYDIFALITLTEIIMTSLIFLIEVDMPNSLFERGSHWNSSILNRSIWIKLYFKYVRLAKSALNFAIKIIMHSAKASVLQWSNPMSKYIKQNTWYYEIGIPKVYSWNISCSIQLRNFNYTKEMRWTFSIRKNKI